MSAFICSSVFSGHKIKENVLHSVVVVNTQQLPELILKDQSPLYPHLLLLHSLSRGNPMPLLWPWLGWLLCSKEIMNERYTEQARER
jgi:hypothetical protein